MLSAQHISQCRPTLMSSTQLWHDNHKGHVLTLQQWGWMIVWTYRTLTPFFALWSRGSNLDPPTNHQPGVSTFMIYNWNIYGKKNNPYRDKRALNYASIALYVTIRDSMHTFHGSVKSYLRDRTPVSSNKQSLSPFGWLPSFLSLLNPKAGHLF